MDITDAQIEAPRAWGDKKANEYSIDPHKRKRIGSASKQNGSQPLPTDRNDWSWRDLFESCRQTNAGGIVDRLIQCTVQQIKESEDRTADLKEQLAELEQISKTFFEKET